MKTLPKQKNIDSPQRGVFRSGSWSFNAKIRTNKKMKESASGIHLKDDSVIEYKVSSGGFSKMKKSNFSKISKINYSMKDKDSFPCSEDGSYEGSFNYFYKNIDNEFSLPSIKDLSRIQSSQNFLARSLKPKFHK